MEMLTNYEVQQLDKLLKKSLLLHFVIAQPKNLYIILYTFALETKLQYLGLN